MLRTTLKSTRYRPFEAVVVALLAALVTTCAVVAPLHERAMQQAQLRQLAELFRSQNPKAGS